MRPQNFSYLIVLDIRFAAIVWWIANNLHFNDHGFCRRKFWIDVVFFGFPRGEWSNRPLIFDLAIVIRDALTRIRGSTGGVVSHAQGEDLYRRHG